MQQCSSKSNTSIFPSTLSSFPVPAGNTPHSMMLPPPAYFHRKFWFDLFWSEHFLPSLLWFSSSWMFSWPTRSVQVEIHVLVGLQFSILSDFRWWTEQNFSRCSQNRFLLVNLLFKYFLQALRCLSLIYRNSDAFLLVTMVCFCGNVPSVCWEKLTFHFISQSGSLKALIHPH